MIYIALLVIINFLVEYKCVSKHYCPAYKHLLNYESIFHSKVCAVKWKSYHVFVEAYLYSPRI